MVNERSTAYVTVDFAGKDRAPAVPLTVSYRIHDQGSGTVIRDTTAIHAEAEIEITLTADDNAILSDREYETRVVTITAVYGFGDQVVEEFSYRVRNLAYVAA